MLVNNFQGYINAFREKSNQIAIAFSILLKCIGARVLCNLLAVQRSHYCGTARPKAECLQTPEFNIRLMSIVGEINLVHAVIALRFLQEVRNVHQVPLFS